MTRRWICAVVLLGLAGCSGEGARPTPVPTPSSDTRLAKSAGALPQRTTTPMPAARLAAGLTPPTNKWFSGVVFGRDPQPVFPLPLAFVTDPGGFGFGIPQVVASANSIVGSHQEDVAVTVDGATTQVVTDYDDVSFTLSSRNDGGHELGRTVVAEGSPFITHRAAAAERLDTSVTWTPRADYWLTNTPAGSYGLVVGDGSVEGSTIRLQRGSSAVFFPVPTDGDAATLAGLARPVSGTSASYDVGATTVSTTIRYSSHDSSHDSAFVVMPHQADGLGPGVNCDLGSFPSVYGALPLCRGASLTWTVPRRRAIAGLDLSALGQADRAALASQVASDVATAPVPPADTYFGGKWLYREAQLLEIADQVGADEAADLAQQSLAQQLATWTDPDGCADRAERCFVYDPQWHGIVGLPAAFGSDQFNDHHFHYGYFLYAAGVLAKHDPTVVARLRPVMDLLAADIASRRDSGVTPRLRVFDPYAGHSWASGTADFADGNNQESSSEAVSAWAGLSLWAEATHNQPLARQAAWMLSAEAASARAYWVDPTLPSEFTHQSIGIAWGGKLDYATWFSPEPSAILGIQLIPMSPSSGYLASDPARVRASVSESGSPGPLSDYVLMYAALAGEPEASAALTTARDLPDSAVDDGNSRSYLLAFLMSHQ